jgi:hypothetical protein
VTLHKQEAQHQAAKEEMHIQQELPHSAAPFIYFRPLVHKVNHRKQMAKQALGHALDNIELFNRVRQRLTCVVDAHHCLRGRLRADSILPLARMVRMNCTREAAVRMLD